MAENGKKENVLSYGSFLIDWDALLWLSVKKIRITLAWQNCSRWSLCLLIFFVICYIFLNKYTHIHIYIYTRKHNICSLVSKMLLTINKMIKCISSKCITSLLLMFLSLPNTKRMNSLLSSSPKKKFCLTYVSKIYSNFFPTYLIN